MELAPVTFGEKVVVLGSEFVEGFRPTVTDITWLDSEARFRIDLLWGSGDESKVYSSDIGKTWLPAARFEEKKKQAALSIN